MLNSESWQSHRGSDESALLEMASAMALSEIEQLGPGGKEKDDASRATGGAGALRGVDASPFKKANRATRKALPTPEPKQEERMSEAEIRAEDLRKVVALGGIWMRMEVF